tara:strand:+ start:57 stop:1424 length:1368 start_codon:yes stop_codon:yes gene_type:complete
VATFEEQVEGLTSLTVSSSGTAPTQAELTQFLTDGASEVINAMPRKLKLLCATEDTFTSAAVGSEPETLKSGQVLSVTRSDGTIEQPCREIPAILRGRVSDTDEMNAATATDPAYYIYNGKLNAIPTSGSCKYLEVNKPTVAYGDDSMDDSLTAFPLEYEYLIPLYASIKSLQNAMGNKTSDLPSDITFPSIPVAPAAPSFDTGAISVSSSAPTYTSPAFLVPTLGQMPSIPTVPVLSAQSVTISGSAPTYLGPSHGQVAAYIDTDEDVELAQAKLQEVSSQMQNSLNRFNDDNVEYQAKLQKDIQDSQLSDANEARKLQKYSSEVQSYSAEVNRTIQEWSQDYGFRLQEHGNNLQDSLNEFNKENTVFQNELQEKIQEAKNQQTKDSAEYSAKLQKYSNEMQGYAAEVNKSVQDFNTKLQKHTTDYGWLQSQHQQLSADYQRGIQLLRGGPAPQ